MAMTQTQLAMIKQTTARRTHLGRGEGRAGTGKRNAVHRTATGAPTTKSRPAAAASGLLANAVRRSPSRKAAAARVVPQVGQGIPVSERKLQGRKLGTIVSHRGRRATAETAAASHRNASCRPSVDIERVLTSRLRPLRVRP